MSGRINPPGTLSAPQFVRFSAAAEVLRASAKGFARQAAVLGSRRCHLQPCPTALPLAAGPSAVEEITPWDVEQMYNIATVVGGAAQRKPVMLPYWEGWQAAVSFTQAGQLCERASRSALQVTQPRSTNPKHMHVSGLLQGLDYSEELRERVLERHGGQEPLCSIAVGRRGF